MCGFAGFLDPGSTTDPLAYASIAAGMAKALAPRGPDDEGLWCSTDEGIALAFRRLSIIDLSPAGHQPMHSTCGRYVLAFNGEIYNFEELRRDLDMAHRTAWRGHCDSEVLLEALARWGIEATLPKLDGMFAFALWDRRQRTLTLARDRFGEKPLCYGWQGGCFLFGSTLAPVRQHPAFEGRIDRTAVSAFFSRGYVPSPLTIYTGFYKLPPGTWIEIAPSAANYSAPRLHGYFDPSSEAAAAQRAGPSVTGEEVALDALGERISRSVTRRLHADVPVGVFLSGGIDSSTVAAHAAAVSPTPISTFTISFPDTPNDEAPFARAVADHLGTDHWEMPVTERDALDILSTVPAVYDEPFADPSALPSMVLCARTRGEVKVALSGDGGDEFFGGYPRYRDAARDWQACQETPALLRTAARSLAYAMPDGGLRKSLARLSAASPRDAYLPYVSRWRWRNPAGNAWQPPEWPSPTGLDPAEEFMASDAGEYLPDDLQVKMDRASMNVGLEVRAPLLDHEIARFAWSLPRQLRLHDTEGGKYLLRRLLRRYVPDSLFERPKMGFYQPLPDWLRGDLRGWAEELLSEKALADHGLLDVKAVRRRWSEHQSGRNRALDLWAALMFQQWMLAAR